MSGVLHHSPTYFLKQSLPLTLDLTDVSKLTSQQASGIILSLLSPTNPALGSQEHTTKPGFSCGCWGPGPKHFTN